MPHFHNPKGHVDGWWRNQALDAAGAPRALNLGLVTLAPAGVRFVDAKSVDRSGGGFDNAKAAGLVTGPFASEAEAMGAKAAPTLAASAPPLAPKSEESAPKSEESAPVSEEDPFDSKPTALSSSKKNEGDKKRGK